MSIHRIEETYDIVVVGGGLSGICAAISAARHGARTAIVQNRSMFGGNASSEIRMHIVGASSHAAKKDLAETGILMEILLENKRRNPYACFPVFDSVMWEKVRFQKNLTSYLNTNMDDVEMENGSVRTVICHPELHRDGNPSLRQNLRGRHRPRHPGRHGWGQEPHGQRGQGGIS